MKGKVRYKTTLILLFLTVIVSLPVAVQAKKQVHRVPRDFPTIQEAVDAANEGDVIVVSQGTYSGAVVTKRVTIIGKGRRTIINDGPNSHTFLRAGFLFPEGGQGSGTVIKGFKFEGTIQYDFNDDGMLDFPIFSRGADDVKVIRNVMECSLQAITNWHGSGWRIEKNTIRDLWTLSGGGIGILAGSASGAQAKNNVVSRNRILGQVYVNPDDCGGYDGTGIVLYADHRWGRTGGDVSGNWVAKNKISLSSDTPDIVDVIAIELTDTSGGGTDITDNKISKNDIEDTSWGIFLTGACYNVILKNEIEDSDHVGIMLDEDSCYNLLVKNEVEGSGEVDIKDLGTDNVWKDNECDTCYPEGLCEDDD